MPFAPSLLPLLGCATCGEMKGTYSLPLVALSVVVAVASAYAAIDLGTRVAGASGWTRRVWHASGATMLGVGIWAMHFVGMAAFEMPMPVSYDLNLTVLSMLAAITASGVALSMLNRRRGPLAPILTAALFIGIAINAMHYIGMAAMRMQATLRYDPWLFALSVLIAIGAAGGALVLSERYRGTGRVWSPGKLGAAAVLGFAIAGMHYTGMAAAIFQQDLSIPASIVASGVEVTYVGALAIGTATLIGLGLTLVSSLVDFERDRSLGGLGFLANASDALAQSLERERILKLGTELAAATFGDIATVDLRDDEDPSRLIRRAVTTRPNLPLPEGAGLKASVPHVLSVTSDPRAPCHVLHVGKAMTGTMGVPLEGDAPARGLHGFLSAPISLRTRICGVLTVYWFDERRAPSDRDLALFEELARRLGDALENAALYEEAQRAIAARDAFLSVASHELRTPLTPLLMHLELLQRAVAAGKTEPERLLPKLRTAAGQVRRLSLLVEQLLDISQINEGRLRLKPESIDLTKAVREAVGMLGPEAQKKGCELRLALEEGLTGTLDRIRFEEIIVNLVTNAMKYGAGRPIDVGLARTGSDGVRLWVKDQGIGIAREDQQRIFQRFERAVSERNYGGLGLGLWIVRELILAMGGTIHVTSAPNQGSTFTVELPLVQGTARTPEERTQAH